MKADEVDATRRTILAGERTELAWWRTGLTALAVALAVGRVVPGIEKSETHWPYVAAGACFAAYGVAVIVYGSWRRRTVERALAQGEFPEPAPGVHGALVAGAVALGLITMLLILFD
jgi:putative membrane protein